MFENVDHIGVHATHCCFIHGCKYRDDDCPVVTGKVEQKYLCEDCVNIETTIKVNHIKPTHLTYCLGQFVVGSITYYENIKKWHAETIIREAKFDTKMQAMKCMIEWFQS